LIMFEEFFQIVTSDGLKDGFSGEVDTVV